MDASPLAQLNNRQQQFVMSPIDNASPLWEPSQQLQPVRPNPLQRGPFARNFNSSFGSFSSTSSSSNYINATTGSSSGKGYFDLKNRSKCDLLSPMASLTADISANLSLDPRQSHSIQMLIIVRAQDFLLHDAPSFRLCHSGHNFLVDRHFDRLHLKNIHALVLIQTRLLIHPSLTKCPHHSLSLLDRQLPYKT